jgi:DNA repair exonuclease SbcCD ATPase subunit
MSENTVEKTVKHLESVASEIEDLRHAMQQHNGAAKELQELSSALGELAPKLATLPGEIRHQFSDIPDFITKIRISLEPAGSLEAAIHQAASQQNALHADSLSSVNLARNEIHALRLEVNELRSLIITLGQAQQQAFKAVLNSLDQRTSAIDFTAFCQQQQDEAAATHERLKSLENNTKQLISINQKGFFAKLFGKK